MRYSKKFVVLIFLTVIITSSVNISITFAQIDDHDITSIAERVEQLEAQIAILEAKVAELVTDGTSHTHDFPAPDYDSSWLTIEPGITTGVHHNLGTLDLFVYVIARDLLDIRPEEPYGTYMIHQYAYGSSWDQNLWRQVGLTWICWENSIDITRKPYDIYWNEVRVLIWKLPEQKDADTLELQEEKDADTLIEAEYRPFIVTLILSVITSITTIFALIRYVPAFRVARAAKG